MRTKEQALLATMVGGGWHSHLALRRIGGTRFTARLWDAKQRGYRFEKRFRNGGWEYRRANA